MDYSLILPAFIAGFLMFLAPCTLPLVPGYLGFISGIALEDLKDPIKAARTRWKIFLSGAFFMMGFSAIFISLGILLGFIGASVLAPYRIWLGRIGGIFVIIFGLFMLHPVRNPLRLWRGGSRLERLISNGVNVFKWPAFFGGNQFKTFSIFERAAHIGRASLIFERGRPVNSFILGSAFAFGWTPCIGPILGSILLLASTSTTAFQGGLLLAIFSAGLAVPFLAITIGIGSATKFIGRISKFLNVISVVGGIFLIFLGVLLLTGNMALGVSWGYRLFRFIEYDRLLDYL